jgi:hypothetical protein
MHYPHRIRLRGPWECEPLRRLGPESEAALPPPRRMTLPCRWRDGGLGEFAGRVRFRRAFGYPGQIDAAERVWLTFDGVEGLAEAWLNDTFLGRHDGSAGPFEHEVTGLLQVRNRLVVEIEDATGQGGLWGEVAMEVRRTAFLRAVRAWLEPVGEAMVVHAVGEVVGTAERPLDLYVLLDGATVSYSTVEPLPAGRPFRVTSERRDGREGRHAVRVELVDGATVWYAVEEFPDLPELPTQP